MRSEHARRLRKLESSLDRQTAQSLPWELVLWLEETYGELVGWDLSERLEAARYPDRVGVIVDFLEAAEKVDAGAIERFFEQGRRFE